MTFHGKTVKNVCLLRQNVFFVTWKINFDTIIKLELTIPTQFETNKSNLIFSDNVTIVNNLLFCRLRKVQFQKGRALFFVEILKYLSRNF